MCITTHSTFFFPHINKEVRGVCLQRIKSLVCPNHTFAQNTHLPETQCAQIKRACKQNFFLFPLLGRCGGYTHAQIFGGPPRHLFSRTHARTHWVARQAHTRTNTCGPPRHTFSRTNIASLGGAAGHDASLLFIFSLAPHLLHIPPTRFYTRFFLPP